MLARCLSRSTFVCAALATFACLAIGPTAANADPVPALTPAGNDFGQTQVDTESAPFNFTLANTGDGAFTVTSVTKAGNNPGQFVVKPATTCAAGLVINPGNPSCTIRVTFRPGNPGPKTAQIAVVTDLSPTPVTVNISGNATEIPASRIAVSAVVIPFPTTRIDLGPTVARTVSLTSTGALPVQVGAITAGGQDSTQFPNDAAACANRTLQPQEACLFSVSFDPTSGGQKTAQITVNSNTQAGFNVISLAGVGELPPVTARIKLPASLPRLKGNVAKLPLTCSVTSNSTATNCAGRITLIARGADLGFRGVNRTRNFKLGSTEFSSKPAKGQASVKLKGYARRAVNRRQKVKVQVVTTVNQPDGSFLIVKAKRYLRASNAK